MIYLTLKMWICLLLAALIGLIVGWLLYRSRAVKRELELSNEIDVRNDCVGSLEGQLSARDSKIVSLGSDLERWQSKVPGLESTLAERDDQVMGLTMDLDTWKQKVPALETRLGAADSDRAQLASDLAVRAQNLQDRESEVESLNGEVSSLRKSLAVVNERQAQDASDFNSELTAQRQKLDGLRGELNTATAAHLKEQESAQALTDKAAGLQSDLEALQKHSDSLSQEGREREQALSELRRSLKSQEAERLSLAEQVTSLSPVALRVTSQDQSIASLNQDLRNRDTTIKGLQGEIDAGRSQADELKSSAQSLGLLRTEMDGMRGELTSARADLSSAAQASTDATALAQAKVNSNDTEWRARLRIADSGRQQAQADLYRRQEHIDRLERQLASSESEVTTQKAAVKAAEDSVARAAVRSDGTSSGLAAGTGATAQGLMGAGRVAATDERQWKSRLRIEESARRKAEADALRGNERVLSLEAQLREAQAASLASARSKLLSAQTSPTKVTTKVRDSASAAEAPKPATPEPTAPAATGSRPATLEAAASAAKPTQETESLSSTRFMTSAPKEKDELQKIKGVGKVLEKTLNSLGIYQFRQIALFTADDIAWVDDRLKFKGRIERDSWVKQAEKLHRKRYKSDPAAG